MKLTRSSHTEFARTYGRKLMKIDIEGAEEAIFSADVSGWLPRVRNLCIELHGEKCRKAFFGALTDYDFDHSISGELDICTNLRPRMKT